MNQTIKKKRAATPILDNYRQHWGATQIPFAEEHLQKPYLTDQHEQVLEHLKQSAALRTTLLLTGDNGSGKSMLLGYFIHQKLDLKRFHPLVVTQASLSGSGLLAYLLEKLGGRPGLGRSHNLPRLEKAFNQLGSQTPVIVLDEAQYYDHRALEEIRLLQEYNLQRQRQFALLLAGDPYFLGRLHMQANRALMSRISINLQLSKLDPQQSVAYLGHHLREAGLSEEILSSEAAEMLSAAADGSARVLKHLARAAWLQASAEQAVEIQLRHVQETLPQVPAALSA